MPIEFRCTQCQKLLRTADETAGKKARCPDCGAIVDIPSQPASAEGAPQDPFGDTPHPFGPSVDQGAAAWFRSAGRALRGWV